METAVSCEYLASKASLRDTRKTFCSARLYIWYTLSAPTLYIPTLPTNDKESLWEKTLAKNTWELEIVIPIILYTVVCGIFSSPASQFPYCWEVDSPKHLPHYFRVSSDRLVLLGNIGRSQGWQMQHGAYCGIWKTRQDSVSRSLVGVGAWRA